MWRFFDITGREKLPGAVPAPHRVAAATDLDWGSTSPTSPQIEVDSGSHWSTSLPPRLVAMLRSARSSWHEARAGFCCFPPAASSHTTDIPVFASARIRSTPRLMVAAEDQCCTAHNATRATPAPLRLPCATARAFPTASGGLAARAAPFFFFFGVPTLLLAGRFFFLSLYLQRIAPRAASACMQARLLARARTTDERTMRRAVRRRG